MENQNKKNKNKTLKIFALCGLFLLIFGVSYALFRVTLNGTKINRIKTAKLDVVLDEGEGTGTSIAEILPMSSYNARTSITPYEFDIINQGTLGAVYDLYFVPDSETTLADTDVMYHLTRSYNDNDTVEELSFPTATTQAEINEVVADDIETYAIDNPHNNTIYTSRKMSLDKVTKNGETMYKLDSYAININDTYHYSLQMWVRHNAGNDAMNKVFGGTIRVVVTQAPKGTAYMDDITTMYNSAVGYVQNESAGNTQTTRPVSYINGFVYLKHYTDGSFHFSGNGRASGSSATEDVVDEFKTKYLHNEAKTIATVNQVLEDYNIDVEPYETQAQLDEDFQSMNSEPTQRMQTIASICIPDENCVAALEAAMAAGMVPTKMVSEDGIIMTRMDNDFDSSGVFPYDEFVFSKTMAYAEPQCGTNVLKKISYTEIGSNAKYVVPLYITDYIYNSDGEDGGFTQLTAGSLKLKGPSNCSTLTEVNLPDNLIQLYPSSLSNNANADIKIAAQQANVTVGSGSLTGNKSVTWLNN